MSRHNVKLARERGASFIGDMFAARDDMVGVIVSALLVYREALESDPAPGNPEDRVLVEEALALFHYKDAS